MKGHNHSTFLAYPLENYLFKLSSRSRLHRKGHKSIIGDTKKIIAGKILHR
jgi:hypothetical protein